MIKTLLISIFAIFTLVGCGDSNTPIVSAYGCVEKLGATKCKEKPVYLGEVSFIISKEGKSIRFTQTQAKGVGSLIEDTFSKGDCVITDGNNWSCKEKLMFGGRYIVYQMVDGFFMASTISDDPSTNLVHYVGYSGLKGQLIKYGLWQPTDIFKEDKGIS